MQSGHNFAPVTTAELSWPMQICDLIEWLRSEPKEFLQLWSDEVLVRPSWVSVLT